MIREEAVKMLRAKLHCIEFETSGTKEDCNNHHCDNCSYNYEQGNMGEQKQALEMAIKALEQESCEDCVSRKSIIKTLNEMDRYIADGLILCESGNKFPLNEVFIVDDVYEKIGELPSVKPVACIATVKFNKEDMQKIVHEEVKELKTMLSDAGAESEE